VGLLNFVCAFQEIMTHRLTNNEPAKNTLAVAGQLDFSKITEKNLDLLTPV
jgi:hypothetical protein